MKVIKSERKDMLDREYTAHALGEAAAYGEAAAFWARDDYRGLALEHVQHGQREAFRLARLAARWALKVQGRL
jgi:hypothetical protein